RECCRSRQSADATSNHQNTSNVAHGKPSAPAFAYRTGSIGEFSTKATPTTRNGGCVTLTSSDRQETLPGTGNALIVWWTGMHNVPGEITTGVRFDIETATTGKTDARVQQSITS